MKKTVYLIILAVITIAAIIFGTNYRFKKFNSNFKDFKEDIKSMFEDGEGNFSFDFSTDFSSFNGKIDADLDEFTNIRLDTKVSKVTIYEEGTSFHIYADYNQGFLEPEYKVENGTLNIRQNKINKAGNNNCSIKIIVPRFTDLDKIDVKVDVGELDISNIRCNEAKLKTNVGEVDITDVHFTKLDVENNVGEIDIRTVYGIDNYSLDLETNVGEVNVGGESHRRYSNNVGGEQSIHAKSNVGEISIR